MASAHVIDTNNITTFENLTVNAVADVNTTISELVSKHDALANSVVLFGEFTITETILAIRAGVLA